MDQQERVAIIREVFECSGELAENISANMLHKNFGQRDVILHQGDEVQHCNLVIGGRANAFVVGLEGQYIQLATFEPGEIFGAYPSPDRQRADIIAGSALEILSIESNQLKAFAKQYADVGSGLARIFAAQANIHFDRMTARVTLSAAGRVYAELLNRAGDDRKITPAPVVGALAVAVQTTRETASRAISRLVKRGILIRHDDHWEIVAPRQLEDMIA